MLDFRNSFLSKSVSAGGVITCEQTILVSDMFVMRISLEQKSH